MSELASALWDRLEHRDQVVLTVVRPGDDVAFTGRALHAAACDRAAELLASGWPADKPLVLAMPSGAAFVTTLLGALYAGIAVVPVALPRGATQVDRFNAIVADCGASAILCVDAVRAKVEAARGAAPAGDVPVITVESLRPCSPINAPSASAGPAAIIQYTSGTGRFPRGVLVNGANVLANLERVGPIWGFDADQTFVNWMPHFHDMGLMGILFPMLVEAASFQVDPLRVIQRPARWLRLMSDTGAAISGGPAFAFAHCLKGVRDEDCEGLDLSRWRAAFCGAEPVPTALLAAFRERFAPYGLDRRAVFGTYGLAEYTLMVAGAPGDDGEARPVPPRGCEAVEPCRLTGDVAYDIRIVDTETGEELPDGEPGEIRLRGASVTDGYLGQPEETAATFNVATAGDDGRAQWLRTGDLGVVADRNLYVTGRLKDVLIAMGRKIAAAEVEWLAGEQSPALDPLAAAAVMPDELASGHAALLIETRFARAAPPDVAAVKQKVRQAVLGTYGIQLHDIRLLARGELPRTSSGKIRRRAAADLYRQGKVSPGLA